jgi:Rod binding domain-containing protein
VSSPSAIGSLTAADGSASGSQPVINEALEPASVRNGSAAVKQAYQSALNFESLLVGQLAQQLVQSAGLSGSSSSTDSSDSSGDTSGSDASANAFGSMLPGALTSAIMSDGGLGIAAQLLPDFESQTTPATAGSSAPPAPSAATADSGTAS